VQRIVLRSGDAAATVDVRRGARLASLRFGGTEVLVTAGSDPVAWGCYPMVPYAGRVRDARLRFAGRTHDLEPNAGRHAMHGTVFAAPWELDSHDIDSATLVTSLGPHWPFEGTVVQRFEVSDDGITMRLAVHAGQDQPVHLGWHPWFLKPARLDHRCRLMHVRDRAGIATSEVIPVPDEPLDDCLVSGGAEPELTVRDVDLRLSSDCSHWVVYDMHDHATCVEPQSGPPNAINDSPDIVPAGSIMSRWFRIVRAR